MFSSKAVQVHDFSWVILQLSRTHTACLSAGWSV